MEIPPTLVTYVPVERIRSGDSLPEMDASYHMDTDAARGFPRAKRKLNLTARTD